SVGIQPIPFCLLTFLVIFASMKRGRKSKRDVIDLEALRQELSIKHMSKIHPSVKQKLQTDGVLDEVCNHLVDLDFIDRRLPYPSRGHSDFTRLYDYHTDSYLHVHFRGKNYGCEAIEIMDC